MASSLTYYYDITRYLFSSSYRPCYIAISHIWRDSLIRLWCTFGNWRPRLRAHVLTVTALLLQKNKLYLVSSSHFRVYVGKRKIVIIYLAVLMKRAFYFSIHRLFLPATLCISFSKQIYLVGWAGFWNPKKSSFEKKIDVLLFMTTICHLNYICFFKKQPNCNLTISSAKRS